ncbi:MAG: hypothetical protein RL685_3895 [Pseudomonadota bacterium]|jgi:hypothetical protein
MVFRVPDPIRTRWRLSALASWVGAAVLSACGPSFEVLAEGDLRFAHCDRLDLDSKIAPSHRLHCWREWRRTYTYGQTRDRVEYAQRRIAEVVSGDTDSAFQLPAAEPAPTRVAPAPHGAREPVGAGTPLLSAALAPTVPLLPPEEQACRDRCQRAQVACSPGCETRPTGCEPCPQPLEACLKDCKTDAP